MRSRHYVQHLSIQPSLRRYRRHAKIDAALIGLVDVRGIPVHLDHAIASVGALGSQIGRHFNAEALLAGDGGDRVGGVDVPGNEVAGDEIVVRGVDDGDVRYTGVGRADGESQGDGLAGGVFLDVAG